MDMPHDMRHIHVCDIQCSMSERGHMKEGLEERNPLCACTPLPLFCFFVDLLSVTPARQNIL